MTINKIFNELQDLQSQSLKAETIEHRLHLYDYNIKDLFGDQNINSLKYVDYQKFANSLLKSGRKPQTVKNILSVLSSIYKFAIKLKYYNDINIIRLVELPFDDNRRYFSMDIDLQKKYIRALIHYDEPIYKDIFFFFLHGRRKNEVLLLKWHNVDVFNGVIRLPAKNNKSKRNLSFVLTEELRVRLLEHHTKARINQNTLNPVGFVFCNVKNNCLPFKDLRKAWDRFLESNNLPKITMHQIRNLVASYLSNELLLPLQVVQHTMGHSSIETTQRYINPKPEHAKISIDALIESVKDVQLDWSTL